MPLTRLQARPFTTVAICFLLGIIFADWIPAQVGRDTGQGTNRFPTLQELQQDLRHPLAYHQLAASPASPSPFVGQRFAPSTSPRHTVRKVSSVVSDDSNGITGDWPQWGGNSQRNNVPNAQGIPTTWNVGGFDRKTRAWKKEEAQNVKWMAELGSQTYGNAVVADGRVFVGTNNGAGYLDRYPASEDLGCLLAFDIQDGSFLWQHSSEKLPTGRVHDWPLQGICCAPLVEGKRLWFVTSRGEVVCCDTEGFYDNENDGPVTDETANLFKENPLIDDGLDRGRLSSALEASLEDAGITLEDARVRVKKIEEGKQWALTIRAAEKNEYQLVSQDGQLQLFEGEDTTLSDDAEVLATIPIDLTAGLDAGTVGSSLQALLKARGVALAADATASGSASTGWKIQSGDQQITVRRGGPSIIATKKVTVADQREADTIWVLDMMKELQVSQHNMCSCSVTSYGDILFVNTSNGVDESHVNIPSVDAPSFIALDKNTGKVLWTDGSPAANILHGQWSSPTIANLEGGDQVIFGGGDGWLYSFQADQGSDGKPKFLWKFDANPKDSEWILGGLGTRNNIIATPVVYQGKVYVAVGQDPEHGEGVGHLWCIDPTKRGDVSHQLAVNVNDRKTPIPHRRLQAIDAENGEVSIDNPNSAAVWHYDRQDQDGDGKFAYAESIHRSCGTVAIKDDLLFIADFSGIFHCLDAISGKVHWSFDMKSQAWGSPLIVDGHVYIGNENGDIYVFRLTQEKHDPVAQIDMLNSVYSTPIVSDNILYITNKTHLFAIEAK